MKKTILSMALISTMAFAADTAIGQATDSVKEIGVKVEKPVIKTPKKIAEIKQEAVKKPEIGIVKPAKHRLTEGQIKALNEVSIFKNKDIRVVDGYEDAEHNLYILKAEALSPRGSQIVPAFYSKISNTVFVGSAYDSDGKKITAPVDKDAVKAGVAFTYGSGKKGDIYLFTDPECPFCQRLEQTYEKELAEHTVHVILFPLSFHKDAKPMTQWILSGKDNAEKAERYHQVMKGGKEWKNASYDPAKKDFLEYLKKSTKAFNEVGARGTPTLRDASMKEVNPGNL